MLKIIPSSFKYSANIHEIQSISSNFFHYDTTALCEVTEGLLSCKLSTYFHYTLYINLLIILLFIHFFNK